jgi:hypothetical protein
MGILIINNMEQKGFIKIIRENWVLVVFVCSLVVTWTTFRVNQLDFEKRLTRTESQIETINPVLLQLQTSMARVETTLEFIKMQISK